MSTRVNTDLDRDEPKPGEQQETPEGEIVFPESFRLDVVFEDQSQVVRGASVTEYTLDGGQLTFKSIRDLKDATTDGVKPYCDLVDKLNLAEVAKLRAENESLKSQNESLKTQAGAAGIVLHDIRMISFSAFIKRFSPEETIQIAISDDELAKAFIRQLNAVRDERRLLSLDHEDLRVGLKYLISVNLIQADRMGSLTADSTAEEFRG